MPRSAANMLRRLASLAAACLWATAFAQSGEPPKYEKPLAPQSKSPGDLPGPSARKDGDPEEEQELTLRDGRTIIGKLIETSDDKIVFLVGGVATPFAILDVAKIASVPSVEERYNQLKAAIDINDAPGLMRLAEWTRAHGRYDLALTEIDAAIKADPGNPDARQLKILIVQQQRIADEAKKRATKPTAPGTDTPAPNPANDPTAQKAEPAKPPKETPFPLLTEDQMNVIRVYEVDVNNPPKMTISRDVIDKFLDRYAGQAMSGRGTLPAKDAGEAARAIYAHKKPSEILSDMFSLKARDYYPQVKVLENPKALQLFRDNVNRNWLVNSCATSRCHGGEDAGRLWLYKKAATDAAAYTNFLILDRFRIPSEDKTLIPIINYASPELSPLLQMGLPRAEAKFKHPDVTTKQGRWKPVFDSTKDEKFIQAVDWIKAMYPDRIPYPIDYKAPVPRPKSEDKEAPVAPR